MRFFPEDWRREIAQKGRTPVWVLGPSALLFLVCWSYLGVQPRLVLPGMALALCVWCWAIFPKGAPYGLLVAVVPAVGALVLSLVLLWVGPRPTGGLVTWTGGIGALFSSLLRIGATVGLEEDAGDLG